MPPDPVTMTRAAGLVNGFGDPGMVTVTTTRATLDDLYREPGKAELVGGRIVRLPPMGHLPGQIVGRIAVSLYRVEEQEHRGEVGTATLAYVVPELPSGRESFSPDVSYYLGPLPEN